MDDRDRRENDAALERSASDAGERREREDRQGDELTARREQIGGRQPLTRRERDERWPIG
jgi:hypothetical protein